MSLYNHYNQAINQSINLKKILIDKSFFREIQKAINFITKCVKKKNKLLLCGNGGSAADAQHLAAEFLVRLNPKINRKPIAAIPLLMDTSTISACANDYNFSQIFKRNFEALYKKNDILVIFSTSGNSKNIIEVLKFAKKRGIKTIGFLGKSGGKAKKFCDVKILVPSVDVARIQETHIFLGHFIFDEVEKGVLEKN
jgi:D-sedoheptulose 7-phosphate isomerase